jgi:putative endonuclease
MIADSLPLPPDDVAERFGDGPDVVVAESTGRVMRLGRGMGLRWHRVILTRSADYSRWRSRIETGKLPRVSTESRLQSGAASEQLAAEYLRAQGLVVIARNLRCRAGELDLVGLDRSVLAVVEVRQRIRADFGGALASVNRRKQRKIILATCYFLQRRAAWRGHALRFDVVGVEGRPDGANRIVWIKDAFRA